MKNKDKDMTIADHLKGFDFYKDLPQELQEPSVSGASGKYPKQTNRRYSVNDRNGANVCPILEADLQFHAVQQDK